MKRTLVLLSFYSGLLGFYSSAAPATTLKKTTVCAAMLSGLRGYHTELELSVQQTRDAFDRFRIFRMNIALEPPSANLKNLHASPDRPQLNAVAGRIFGLESNYRSKLANGENNDQVNIVAGAVLKGSEEIEGYFDTVNESIKWIDQLRGEKDEVAIARAFHLGGGAFATWVIVSIFASDMVHENRFVLDATLPILAIGPEYLIRFFRSFDNSYSQVKSSTREFLNRSPYTSWQFDSVGYWIPKEILNSIWLRGRFPPQMYDQNMIDIDTLISNKLRTITTGEVVARNDANVQIDRLLYINEQTMQPEMAIFMRMSTGRRPAFPSSRQGNATDRGRVLARDRSAAGK